MMFSSFTFMMNLTINLMNKYYHKCERKKNDPLYSGSTKELLLINKTKTKDRR